MYSKVEQDENDAFACMKNRSEEFFLIQFSICNDIYIGCIFYKVNPLRVLNVRLIHLNNCIRILCSIECIHNRNIIYDITDSSAEKASYFLHYFSGIGKY